MSSKIDWLISIEKFVAGGDFYPIRAAAREIYEISPDTADGPLALAEAEVYLNNLEEAKYYLDEAKEYKIEPLSVAAVREAYVNAAIFSAKFCPVSVVRIFEKFLRDENLLSAKKKLLQEYKEKGDKLTAVYLSILERFICLAVNNYALLGEAKKAKDALYLASEMSAKNSLKLYSNYLFFSNYRALTSSEAKRILSAYGKLSAEHSPRESFYRESGDKSKIRVGYISGIFREHATLSFLPGFFMNPDPSKFEVFVYNLGREDGYSRKLREFPVKWRNLSALGTREAALKISADSLDILVDLAGHAEGSALDVLAYKPAYKAICALGYFASTGAPFMDYVLTDKFLMPLGKSERFTEKAIVLNKHSALCYTPPELFDEALTGKAPANKTLPYSDLENIPFKYNGYPTFLCMQNLLKLSDDVLLLWRKVFDDIGDYKLILQNKTCSTDEGREFLQKHLKSLGYKLSQMELLPYAPDYKDTFKKADVILDTTPYPGGVTTCEALYAACPVVTLRGNDPWARLGASILTAAHLEELVADSPKEYVSIMLAFAKNPQKIVECKKKIAATLGTSRLMDAKGYAKELFALYERVYNER